MPSQAAHCTLTSQLTGKNKNTRTYTCTLICIAYTHMRTVTHTLACAHTHMHTDTLAPAAAGAPTSTMMDLKHTHAAAQIYALLLRCITQTTHTCPSRCPHLHHELYGVQRAARVANHRLILVVPLAHAAGGAALGAGAGPGRPLRATRPKRGRRTGSVSTHGVSKHTRGQ